jgi:hypothetical protein
MSDHKLTFVTNTFDQPNGKLFIPVLHDDTRIELIIEELMAIYQREQNRPMGYNHIPYHGHDLLLEAIGLLEKAIEWPGDPGDEYGEPPMTMDEMHTAAWKEHQEAHR